MTAPGANDAVPLRLVIVDDEPLSRRALRQLLDQRDDVVIVAECAEAEAARHHLTEVDALLLDIEMPGQSGLAFARAHGTQRLPAMVFVTAFDRYAVPAFATEALDYLCKPVVASELERAIGRIREHVRRVRAETPVEPSPRHASPPPLIVRTGRVEEVVPWQAVDCVEADDVYAAVHVGTRRWLVRHSLTTLVESLPPAEFLRVHRSWIVRRGAVRALRTGRDGLQLILHSGKTIPVSRRSAAGVRDWIRGG